MRKKRSRPGTVGWFATATVLVAALLAARPGHATKTYFIGESTDFTGNGCQNADLNDVTSSLKNDMDLDGWTGTRFANASSFPRDFIESCSSNFWPSGVTGIDGSFGDTKVLSVYAGHGNVGLLQWGFPNSGICTLDFSSNMRLGSMGGAVSGHGMYITSCTLKVESLANEANFQWERQQFGFDNSPSVGDNDAATFYDCTAIWGGKNVGCWLGSMEDKPGWFTGDNSPIVVSYGTNSSDCQNTANTADLGSDVLNSNRGGGPSCNQGQPGFHFCFTWIDHGGC